MWRLFASLVIALFVTFPLCFAAVGLAVEYAAGKLVVDETALPTSIGLAPPAQPPRLRLPKRSEDAPK